MEVLFRAWVWLWDKLGQALSRKQGSEILQGQECSLGLVVRCSPSTMLRYHLLYSPSYAGSPAP